MAQPIRTEPARLRTASFEFRAADNSNSTGDGRTLDGYAAVFNVATEIDSWEGSFQEVIAPGAFKRTLRARTPVMQFDHGHDMRTGSVPIGAFTDLAEDETGLHVVGRLFDNDLVEPIRQAIQGGAISGMSFRFRVTDDVWTDNAGKKINASELSDMLWDGAGERGPITRTIRSVDLLEAGPVVFPAYEATSVGVRSLFDRMSDNEREALLRLADELRDQQDDSEPDREVTPEPAVVDEPDADVPDGADEPGEPTEPAESSEPEAPAANGTAETQPESSQEGSRHMAPSDDDRMTVAERAARQEEIRSRLTEIDNEFAGAALPDDTRAEWDRLLEEQAEHKRAIDDANERRAQLAQTFGDPKSSERVGVPPVRKPIEAPNVVIKRSDIYNMAAIRQEARSSEELAGLYRDYAMRAIEDSRYPGARDADEARGQAEHLLNKIDTEGTLARRLLATGSPVYQRAFGKAAMAGRVDGLTNEERAALAVGVDSTGGYAVPFTLDPTVILTTDGSINPLRQVARVEQIVTKHWQGITSAGVTVSRADEAAEVVDHSPTLAGPVVIPSRVQGFITFSEEIEMDWNALASEMTMLLQDARDQEEVVAHVTGTGTANSGSGNEPGGLIATLSSSSYVVPTHTESLRLDDLYAVEEDLGPRFRQQASWLANKSIYNQFRRLAQAESALAGDMWVRLSGGQPPELMGYPAYELSSMDDNITTTGSDSTPANNLVLALGDYKRGFIIVDRVGMSIELVPHLFGSSSRLPTGQRGLYAIWRNGSRVLVDNAIRVLNVAVDSVADSS